MKPTTRVELTQEQEIGVPRGACRRLRRAQGGVVRVLEGRVLMTVEGDAQDYWLAPGEALPFAPGERVWIGGWDEAVRCAVSVPQAPWSDSRLLAWRAWLARWAAALLRRPARMRMRLRGLRG
ncbi:DUF2917 domain-containing protein [Paraburkholderia sp. J67]|uniref:DUF2917 domain-containing protein n=1 Tax=Paraburkholderia sp. J67 TaxID=2805435 RepID=UPI002ABE9D35|nr:DUF2917 domain-containing protein [Paraburkholderia sp. J67]